MQMEQTSMPHLWLHSGLTFAGGIVAVLVLCDLQGTGLNALNDPAWSFLPALGAGAGAGFLLGIAGEIIKVISGE
jgi:hypothetical protein